jgi:hypothetical protein
MTPVSTFTSALLIDHFTPNFLGSTMRIMIEIQDRVVPIPYTEHEPAAASATMAFAGPHVNSNEFIDTNGQVVLDASRTLSPIETLPTEIIQHIASRLLRGYKGHPQDTIFVSDAAGSNFDGLLEFRATSRAILAKTDYVFSGFFEITVVAYEARSLLRLWDLSANSSLCQRVRSLVFVARPAQTPAYNARHYQKISEVKKAPEVQEVIVHNNMVTAIITVALRRFRLHSVYIAPSLVTCYPTANLAASTTQHPPTVILNSVLLSKVWLDRFEMGGGSWGTCHGIKPPATHIVCLEKRGWSQVRNLTSISLTLSSSDCESTSSPSEHWISTNEV